MQLAPFGALNADHEALRKAGTGLFRPMKAWRTGQNFKTLMQDWLADVEDSIWPAWNDGWHGASAATKEAATRAELALAVRRYHSPRDVLDTVPDIPPAPVGTPRTQGWHYSVEDAMVHDLACRYDPKTPPSFDHTASRTIGSNFLLYDPDFDIQDFERLFWGRMPDMVPATWDIKLHFQRPRPWAAATALGVQDFRWVVAGGEFASHTGTHPSLLSGHCLQGLLGGCAVLDALLEGGGTIGTARLRAIQKYMVDWGDRRVFAGVHYMTDNIASWTLARRLIPHLFDHPGAVEALAVEAITTQSRVFADILRHFDPDSPALGMLLNDFPEAP